MGSWGCCSCGVPTLAQNELPRDCYVVRYKLSATLQVARRAPPFRPGPNKSETAVFLFFPKNVREHVAAGFNSALYLFRDSRLRVLFDVRKKFHFSKHVVPERSEQPSLHLRRVVKETQGQDGGSALRGMGTRQKTTNAFSVVEKDHYNVASKIVESRTRYGNR